MNNSSFFIPESSNLLPQNIYQAAHADNNGDGVTSQPEKEAAKTAVRDKTSDDSEELDVFKTQKKSQRGNSNGDIGNINSMMLNDISPIAHIID